MNNITIIINPVQIQIELLRILFIGYFIIISSHFLLYMVAEYKIAQKLNQIMAMPTTLNEMVKIISTMSISGAKKK